MESESLKNLRNLVRLRPIFQMLLQISRETGIEIYLVGGMVRDALLGRESRDVDLALSGKTLETALRFAQKTGGTYVLLKEEKETARVVLPGWTVDFAGFRGPDLKSDLGGRDFTINAIALPFAPAFEEREWTPFDPLGGMEDLGKRILRMCGPRSFLEDPLRMLRAFRFMSQLGLTIDPETRQAVKHGAALLAGTAPERIHYELKVMFSQAECVRAFRVMDEEGLAEVLFPDLALLKAIDQKGYHHLDVFHHSVLTLQSLEDLLRGRIEIPEALRKEVEAYAAFNGNLPALKWAALFHDLGKIDAVIETAEKTTFYGHEEYSLKRFEVLAARFRLSHQEKDLIGRLIRMHMRPHFWVNEKRKGSLSRRAILRFIREAGEELSAVFLLSLADSLAAQGGEKPKDTEELLQTLWLEAIALRDEVVRPLEKNSPLITGRDLIALGLKPGPEFQKILESVQESYMDGEISNRDEALALIKGKFLNKKAKV
ncbi:MAG TPA: HD domain-containing protein [Thermodesulfobacteriota bacterium]|nr:HD domain-containing protein [Thermodesulfobacteriota bacterium]